MQLQNSTADSSTVISWSPQQQAFIDWCINGKGSCILVAVAGAGKTSVLIEAGIRMPGDVLYLAYNRDISTETDAKLKKLQVDWRKMRAATVHSAGLGIIRKAVPGVQVDDKKTRKLFEARVPENHLLRPRMGEVLQLVSLAKQAAFGTAGPSIEDQSAWLQMAAHFDVLEEGGNAIQMIELAQQILNESNTNLEVVDYDDMVYLPVLHKLPCWRHSVIMIDEAQDTNAARRALVRIMLRKGGRVIAVGDPAQAIYGFTGADSDSLELIAKDFAASEMPLTVSFRCPKAVVQMAQQWVSHIEAAETAPEGSVSEITLAEFMSRKDLNGLAAVLCRVNRPLVSLAFALLRKRIPCKIAGRADVGATLKKLLTRWKVNSLDVLEDRLDDYLAKQTTKLLAKKQESRVAALEDSVETCRVIIDACRTAKKYQVSDAVAWIDSMFTDEKGLNLLMLSSIHKSKGREWQKVFWLDRAGTCPSKWARQAWQQEQEKNLQYVCATRAKAELIDVVVPPSEEDR
jgi:superfamily I DNA/RNA helicase